MLHINNFTFSVMTLLAIAVPSVSFANLNDSEGKVWMLGEIVESACTIDSGSLDQTVDMGVLPIGVLLSEGEGPTKDFQIKLIDCLWGDDTQSNYSNLDITFTGNTDGKYFLVNGDAAGVVLELEDVNKKPIIPGEKINYPGGAQNLSNQYFLKLLPNGELVKPGNYYSLLHFNINYN